VLTIAVCTLALSVIAFSPILPVPVYMAIGFVAGLSSPPIQPAVRTIYPKLVPGKQVSALFSLDASAQEVIWILGPVVAVFVSTQLTPVFGILVAAAFMVGGGVWFTYSPEVGRVRIPRARRRLGAVLTRPTVIVATVCGFFFVASFAAIEAGIVAAFGHEGIESGILLALFSAGSIVGGFLMGHRDVRPWSMTLRLLIVTAGTALCLVSLDPVYLGVVLFFAGFGVAPMFAAVFSIVSSTVKFSETAEAYGWVGTGQLVGAGIGSAVAGVSIDGMGPMGGVLMSTLFLVATVIAASISVPWIPDLKGKDASPIPDTEPIQLNP